MCAAPWISRIAITGTGGASTRSEIVAEPERDCASVAVTGSDFDPGVVVGGTVARYVKTRSPAATSAPRPSSANACVAEPPMDVRSPVTPSPVLEGFAPGVTAAVRVAWAPGSRELGLAAPTTVGLVGGGGPSHVKRGLKELRGAGGELAKKSAALLSVSL